MGDIVNKLFTTITNILVNGTVGVTNHIISNGTATTTASYVTAYQTLLDSKADIQDQTITYINNSLSTFTYNASKCSRDVGLIVDSIAQDLLFNGSSQATFTGIQYWNQNGYTGIIASELTTTTNAIAYVRDLAKKIVVNSTKSMTGHLLGGAGGLEAVFTALAVHKQLSPPTINIFNQDPACDLDYCANAAREMTINVAVKNSFGFGGTNGTLIFGKL
jgi:hypothetical protein